jgi:hypothetical protein
LGDVDAMTDIELIQRVMKKAERLILNNGEENPAELAATAAVILGFMCSQAYDSEKTLNGMFQISRDTLELMKTAEISDRTTQEIIERLMENRND